MNEARPGELGPGERARRGAGGRPGISFLFTAAKLTTGLRGGPGAPRGASQGIARRGRGSLPAGTPRDAFGGDVGTAGGRGADASCSGGGGEGGGGGGRVAGDADLVDGTPNELRGLAGRSPGAGRGGLLARICDEQEQEQTTRGARCGETRAVGQANGANDDGDDGRMKMKNERASSGAGRTARRRGARRGADPDTTIPGSRGDSSPPLPGLPTKEAGMRFWDHLSPASRGGRWRSARVSWRRRRGARRTWRRF